MLSLATAIDEATALRCSVRESGPRAGSSSRPSGVGTVEGAARRRGVRVPGGPVRPEDRRAAAETLLAALEGVATIPGWTEDVDEFGTGASSGGPASIGGSLDAEDLAVVRAEIGDAIDPDLPGPARRWSGSVRAGLGRSGLRRSHGADPHRAAGTTFDEEVVYAPGNLRGDGLGSATVGLEDTPAVAGGRVPLVLEILAPNRRPVQVTDDLAGFWKRTYPALRKELRRRYPKHPWP